jgi:hypothetical protein
LRTAFCAFRKLEDDKISPFAVVFCDNFLSALSFSSPKKIIAKVFLQKQGAVFSFFLTLSHLPLQTSVAEGSRSSGKSRVDEAIQSCRKKKRNALPELDSMESARSSIDIIMTEGNPDFRLPGYRKILFQIWWHCPSNINFLSEGQNAKYIKFKRLY